MLYRYCPYELFIVVVGLFATIPVSALSNPHCFAAPVFKNISDSIIRNAVLHWKTHSSLETQESEKTKSWREFENNFRLDFFLTLNGTSFHNPSSAEQQQNLFMAYYQVSINNRLKLSWMECQLYIWNEFGYRYTAKNKAEHVQDLLHLKMDLLSKTVKEIQWIATIQSKTQLHANYQMRNNTATERFLHSAYYSPGYILFNTGISKRWPKQGKLELGLVGGEITRIRRQEIFTERQETELYGLKEGEQQRMEYGMNIQFQQPLRPLSKQFYWENQSRLFSSHKNLSKPENYKLNIQNSFYFLTLKYIRLGLKTEVVYDPMISSKVFMSNLFLFGFHLYNKL
jgi:hypothetical protein